MCKGPAADHQGECSPGSSPFVRHPHQQFQRSGQTSLNRPLCCRLLLQTFFHAAQQHEASRGTWSEDILCSLGQDKKPSASMLCAGECDRHQTLLKGSDGHAWSTWLHCHSKRAEPFGFGRACESTSNVFHWHQKAVSKGKPGWLSSHVWKSMDSSQRFQRSNGSIATTAPLSQSLLGCQFSESEAGQVGGCQDAWLSWWYKQRNQVAGSACCLGWTTRAWHRQEDLCERSHAGWLVPPPSSRTGCLGQLDADLQQTTLCGSWHLSKHGEDQGLWFLLTNHYSGRACHCSAVQAVHGTYGKVTDSWFAVASHGAAKQHFWCWVGEHGGKHDALADSGCGYDACLSFSGLVSPWGEQASHQAADTE